MWRKFLTIVVALVFFFAIISLAGCSGKITARGQVFYPKENNGELWKSRQANPSKPITHWSWGLAEEKPQN